MDMQYGHFMRILYSPGGVNIVDMETTSSPSEIFVCAKQFRRSNSSPDSGACTKTESSVFVRNFLERVVYLFILGTMASGNPLF